MCRLIGGNTPESAPSALSARSLADRLEHEPSTTADLVLARVRTERREMERAGWFN